MKILGSDYDGTLTHEGITPEKCATIRKWRAAGNLFGIISGRNADFRAEVKRSFPDLELDFFAACNGGVIVDGDGNLLYEACCETVSPAALTADLLRLGCPFVHVNTDRYLCVVKDTADAPTWVDPVHVCLLENIPPLGLMRQISIQLDTVEAARAMTEQIATLYGEHLNPLQNSACVDIVPRGVNKAQGLYRLMELFSCRYEDVIAVGDNVNDLDMLREFRSFAMCTAPDAVKAAATAITTGVDHLIEAEMNG